MEQVLQMRSSALKTLGKANKSKEFGFLEDTFEAPKAKLLIAHSSGSVKTWTSLKPGQTHCELFYGKPTPEEAFYHLQVVSTCEDHGLKDHEKN